MGFRGSIIQINPGAEGLIGSTAHPEVTPGRFIDCDNIEFRQGSVRKEGGASKYNSVAITGDPKILGGHDWWPTSGVQRSVVWTDAGDLLKDSGAGTFGTTLASGLSTPAPLPVFVEGGKEAAANDRKLFILSGTNQVKVLAADGATVSNITTPAADWSGGSFPTTGCNHEGRFVAAGNANDPHRIYYSTATNHEDMTGSGSGSISIFPGEGERVYRVQSFKNQLVVWKHPAGVYAVDTTPVDVADWKAYKLSNEVGIAGPLAACAIDDDILFLSPGGQLNLLSTLQEFGNLGTRNVSNDLLVTDLLLDLLNFGELDKTHAVFYANKREAQFFVPALGSVDLNMRIVVDFGSPIIRLRKSSRDTGMSMWLRKLSDNLKVPYTGGSDGFVWRLDDPDKSIDSIGFEGMFQTPHLDGSHVDPALATKNKTGMFIELLVEPKGNWNLSIDTYWDGDYQETVHFNMGSTGAVLGSFLIGTDALSQISLLNKKRRIVGSGKRFSMKARNSGAGQDFAISKIFVYIKVNDEDPTE